MKVYLQTNSDGLPIDYDHYSAAYGFNQMGFEVIPFSTPEQLSTSSIEDVVVGYSGPVKSRLYDFGIQIPNIDYPESISRYLGRKIWKSTINTINNNPDFWGVFVKPVYNKSFSGRVVRSAADLIGCGSGEGDQPVYVSDILTFISEYRAFVRYNQIVDLRHYAGDWTVYPDVEVIKSCVAEYSDGPHTYAIDFGVTEEGKTCLIEVNVSGSIGSYGLDPLQYAKFMSARWSELTGTQDECAFDR